MAAPLAPGFAVDSVAPLDRARARLRKGGPLAPRDVRALVEHYLNSCGRFEEAAQALREWLSEGAQASEIRRDCEMMRGAIDLYLSSLSEVFLPMEGVPSSQPPRVALPDSDLAKLRQARSQVMEIQASLSGLLGLLNARPRPIDRARLRTAEEELERNEKENLADAVARLKAGGDF